MREGLDGWMRIAHTRPAHYADAQNGADIEEGAKLYIRTKEGTITAYPI